jgi:hypothetical protein
LFPSGKNLFASALGFLIFLGATISTPAADDPLAWPPITSQTQTVGVVVVARQRGGSDEHHARTATLSRRRLGGVQITSIYGVNGAEARDIPYLTPAWLAMMGYTVDEAKKLGMGVDMTLGSGWCFGGPTVSDQDANANVVVKNFDLGAGERLQQKFDRKTTQALVAFSPDGKSVELTDKISADGEVDWTAPSGSWKVYAISQNPPAKSQTPRARRRRLDAESRLSAGHDQLADVVRQTHSQIITAPSRRPSFKIPTNTAPTGRRIFSRNLKNVAATNCRPNCPRFSATNVNGRPRRAREIRLSPHAFRNHGRAIRAGVD